MRKITLIVAEFVGVLVLTVPIVACGLAVSAAAAIGCVLLLVGAVVSPSVRTWLAGAATIET